jgi:hypothetical protein
MKNLKDISKTHGRYIPKNMKKYVGRLLPVVRSSWERSFMQWLDVNPYVLEWSSESIYIAYFDPATMKRRRYFPDFYMLLKDSNGKAQQYIIEIKPLKETHPPSSRGNKSRKTLLYEQKTWITNEAKWSAAIQWCSKMGMIFKVITEKELFGK